MKTPLLKIIKVETFEKLTILMGLIGQFATYIQVFKIFYLKSSHAISFISTIISFISIIFWLLYGIEKNIRTLIICNIFGLIGISLVLWGVILYGDNFL